MAFEEEGGEEEQQKEEVGEREVEQEGKSCEAVRQAELVG